ncbi:alpha/beta fold hydrolase [Aestuariivirga sp. YIM B02566]|uniref:Alpha/beta hydrolase n=1 Tax=Taklimakanibacter albus TaxID=2800327 RepID=A0ACC5QXH9_9HYPH|nr:alpha/beta hydrolase [Aestuariivirga sp. YIM B02566]MBK1865084.1 alpha/beta hydrolase [Aestuariivirga sp. YIM B02566]
MPSFRSDIVDIAYEVTGEGPPVLLIHGFASNARVNWIDTGWVKALTGAGYQTITFDNRGHGESGKLYDPEAYPAPEMAEDARRLLDHLGLSQVRVMGYSMGARIAAFLTLNHPERVSAAVFSGLADNMIRGVGGAEPIAQALEAASIDSIEDPSAKVFRVFAEQTKGDLKALAACMRSGRQKITAAELGRIAVPALVVAGDMDDIAGKVEPLVAAIPGARGVTLARRNHMNAVGDRQHKDEVINFLNSIA